MSGQGKRRHANRIPGRIVRRTRPAVGQQRKVVRRSRAVIGADTEGQHRRKRRSLWRAPGRKFVAVVAALFVVAAMGGAGYAVYESEYLEVSTVEVRGNATVSTDAIVERAGLIGQHMVTADLAEAQRSIAEIPLLASVRLERQWPDTVVVYVEERQAWGAWEQGGVTYTIDREGVVIGTDPAPPGAPVIVSTEIGSRQLGDRVDPHAVDAAAEIYELLPERLGTTVTEVAFLKGKGVQVTTGSGEVALLGDSGGINYKLSVWEAVTAQARAEGIEYSVIDLRYGNRPVLQ